MKKAVNEKRKKRNCEKKKKAQLKLQWSLLIYQVTSVTTLSHNPVYIVDKTL